MTPLQFTEFLGVIVVVVGMLGISLHFHIRSVRHALNSRVDELVDSKRAEGVSEGRQIGIQEERARPRDG